MQDGDECKAFYQPWLRDEVNKKSPFTLEEVDDPV